MRKFFYCLVLVFSLLLVSKISYASDPFLIFTDKYLQDTKPNTNDKIYVKFHGGLSGLEAIHTNKEFAIKNYLVLSKFGQLHAFAFYEIILDIKNNTSNKVTIDLTRSRLFSDNMEFQVVAVDSVKNIEELRNRKHYELVELEAKSTNSVRLLTRHDEQSVWGKGLLINKKVPIMAIFLAIYEEGQEPYGITSFSPVIDIYI